MSQTNGGHTGRLLRQLRTVLRPRAGDGPTDGHLLERFLAERDGEAFAELVRRHGPMVLGVCRRTLGHRQDAEDAFQATFLVLVRRAAAVAPREAVGNWLHGVARRTAQGARRAAARRRCKETDVAPDPRAEPRPDDVWGDLRPVLDEELAGLPEKYRLAVVLCDLEGRARKEVARQLGLPEGTLSSRLTAARRKLADRLARRGVTLSAAVVAAAVLEGAAPACVSARLVGSTVEAALAVAAGGATAGAVVSASAAALAETVIRGMTMGTTKKVVAGLLLFGALGASGGGWAYQAYSADPAVAAADGRPVAGPRADDANDPDPLERLARLKEEIDNLFQAVQVPEDDVDRLARLRAELDRLEKDLLLQKVKRKPVEPKAPTKVRPPVDPAKPVKPARVEYEWQPSAGEKARPPGTKRLKEESDPLRELTRWIEELKKRDHVLNERETELRLREDELKKREADLRKREERLKRWEDERKRKPADDGN